MFTHAIISPPMLRLGADGTARELAGRILRRFRVLFAAKEREDKAGRVVDRAEINRQAEVLLNRYSSSILRLAYSYLHNLEDAEEVLQETLIQFLTHAPVLENEGHEKAWLLRVAGNLSKNRIAYNRVRNTDQLQDWLVAEQREDLSFVWEAVQSLPIPYREVIHLFYYEGYSTGQIAKLLGRKESTVRSHLMRGRQQLKSILKEAYDFGDGVS